ncbi:hypothetical protein [Actinoplanes sp. RD1]|uniref:hypothetical protein n=1 Tax=Actinoplanes sp. RD1 TaxID=3064538 RepID=UPI00274282E4|nr:hypothetical protein [Actinoplanes sp. RD1]
MTLQRLYFIRFGFALGWAALITTVGSEDIDALTVALLVIYPAFDVAAAIVDARTARSTTRAGLVTNIAVSTLAAAGLAVASARPAFPRSCGSGESGESGPSSPVSSSSPSPCSATSWAGSGR